LNKRVFSKANPFRLSQSPHRFAASWKRAHVIRKPKFTSGRQVSLVGDDVEICVDEMKLITVFMNLIGNALKYSDGAVRVAWHIEGQTVLIAVSDQGSGGKGLSRAEADQLFVPFGRPRNPHAN
jgi:signal transduction histidine kinase